MQLIKVYSNKKSFRVAEFNSTGLSFIVAQQKNPGITEKGQTYNGVGKSLLVRIINFCFGAGIKDFETFCEKLSGWEFYVDFVVADNKYTVKRVTDNHNRIFLNGEELSLDKFKTKMASLCFDIPKDVSFLSFRSLFPFFIRPKKESYVTYDKPGKTGSQYQTQLMQNNIDNIDNSLKITPSTNKNDIKAIYEEVKIYFSESISKTLDDLEAFYEKLIINRKKRLLEQKNKLKFEQNNKIIDAKKLQKELDKLMQYLGEHQALDLFVTINNKNAELKSRRDNLKRYQELQMECKDKERQAEKSQLELTEVTESYLKEIESDIVELRDYFRSLAKKIYPDSVAGLTIKNNDGENQLRFNIDAKIESDTSDGINNVKIFCYDLTLLFKGHNHRMNFIFHDSRLFDGIDERQKADIFKTVYEEFAVVNKQYIATVNQNQIDEIKKHLKEDEFKNIITKNIVLTLTDESDSEKLLGIKVDI